MSTYNRVLILGTLGQNPTLKNTQAGKPFCRLSLATDSFNPNALDKKKTSWHQVHVFGKSAENVARYLRKGRQVFVEGRMESDEREENGERRWKTWITADRVTFLNGGKGSDDFKGEMDEGTEPESEPTFPLESPGFLPH
jgi:single-strand DNA-binding protein